MKNAFIKGEVLTIKEVYERCGENAPTFQYVWANQCPHCSRISYTEDEEYTFYGDREDFMENYENGDYSGVLDFESKVFCISPENCFFRYEREDTENEVCPICQRLPW